MTRQASGSRYRSWCRRRRTGRAEGLSLAREYVRAGADEIVLGLGDPIGPAALQSLADEVAVPLREDG